MRAIAVAAAVLATLVALPASAPAQPRTVDEMRAAAISAQDASHFLSAGPKVITKGGRTYRVNVSAFEGGFDGLFIAITEQRDPSGVQFSSRSANWSFFVENVLFPGQSPPRLTTGADLSKIRPYGAVKMAFQQNSITKSCSGKDAVRRGSMTGSFRLVDSRLPFANDTLEFTGMPNAALTTTSGACPPTTSNACGSANQSMQVSKGANSLFADHTDGRNAVDITFFGPSADLKRGTTTIGFFGRSNFQTIPATDNFGYAAQLGSMYADGAGFGFIHGPEGAPGRTTFTANQELVTGAYPCGTGKERVNFSRSGTAASNFRVEQLFGSTVNFSNFGGLAGSAYRSYNRAAS